MIDPNREVQNRNTKSPAASTFQPSTQAKPLPFPSVQEAKQPLTSRVISLKTPNSAETALFQRIFKRS